MCKSVSFNTSELYAAAIDLSNCNPRTLTERRAILNAQVRLLNAFAELTGNDREEVHRRFEEFLNKMNG